MHRVAALASSYQTAGRLVRSLEQGRFGVLHLSRLPTSTSSATPVASVIASRVSQEPFLNGSSSVYVEEMYNAWTADPTSVHKSWDTFFRNANAEPGQAHLRPPALSGTVPPSVSIPSFTDEGDSQVDAHRTVSRDIDDHLSVYALIRSYQVRPGWCDVSR